MALLEKMSPADRVGQLFVVTFRGNTVTADSDIVELIHQERIGGVVLSPVQENFTNAKGAKTPIKVAQLTNQLQALSYGYLIAPGQALTMPLTATLASPLTTTLNAPLTTTLATAITTTFPFSAAIQLPQTTTSPAIPLLLGVEQLGDGYPTTALRRDFTPLPSQMALGATWDPSLVEAVGKIVGQELQAVGVNLLLGPNLNVVDAPRTDPVGALGLYSFGGSSYWVSRMGRAYITGIHSGSRNGIAAIAHHFPGQGDIDRFPDQEVATVQKSLTELRRLSLPPFLSVTRQVSPILAATGDPAAADGLMTSHMRFSALQGGTAGRTVPISLMPDMKMALNNEGLGEWYAAGGIIMTNGLGISAIRRYYDATLREFPYKRVALDAFIAGHDLLYLAYLSPDGSWNTEKQYVKEIVQFFRDRYESDPDFRIQVDQAVYRILRLKFGLYQNQTLPAAGEQPRWMLGNSTMLVPPAQVLRYLSDLAIFAEGSAHRTESATVISAVTRSAMTLLYPRVQNLSDVIPTPPQADDQLLIFSDSRLFRECDGCLAETTLGPEEIKEIITRLYGSDPGATGQIDADRIYGRSFVELAALLDEVEATATQTATATLPATDTLEERSLPSIEVVSTPAPDELTDDSATEPTELLTANMRLQRLIDNSNWIIFAMLDVDPEHKSGSDVVKRFLRQQSEQLGNKKVIVLALNAPYFLDATEISKLTAYFGVYSKIQPSLESAVRVLFRSYTPPGAPPVSVPGTQFNSLTEQLQPDPLSPLQLAVYQGENPLILPESVTAPEPVIQVGDTLRLEVKQVLDHNGHPVPDGVEVEFRLVYEANEATVQAEAATTRRGSATRDVIVEQPGRLLISASAGEAQTTEPVAIRVQNPDVGATPALDSALSTNTAPLTTTASVTTTAPVTALGTGSAPTMLSADSPRGVNVVTLVIAFLTILVTLSLLLILQIRILPRTMLVQNMLWATIFGLSAYIFYGLGVLPGITFLQESLRVWGLPLWSLLACCCRCFAAVARRIGPLSHLIYPHISAHIRDPQADFSPAVRLLCRFKSLG
ncbi:MAG: glycoside hydrolase family 3 N-terminal domain-containing protein [Caldilineaceae bacterium]